MIRLTNVCKNYGSKKVLIDFNLNIKDNSFITITGKSGSGKTTLLNIIGLIDKQSSGTISINGQEKFDKKKIEKLRRYTFGYIFQDYMLLENETVKNNLLISTKYSRDFTTLKLDEVLEAVGLPTTYLDKKVYLLSGGEQQRVAIARIMLKPCEIILADEPTGNLDEENAKIIIGLLKGMIQQGKTVVCVTHDKRMAEIADENIIIGV